MKIKPIRVSTTLSGLLLLFLTPLVSPGFSPIDLSSLELWLDASDSATITTAVSVVAGSTITWNGGGADTLASTPANWAGGIAPQTGDSVQFDATSTKNCDWDLDVELLNWNQTADYTGTVTIWTEYPGIAGGTGFTNLTISGDVTLAGGTWTHRANRGVDEAWDRLRVSVGGNFTLGVAGGILTTKGYAGGRSVRRDDQDDGSGAAAYISAMLHNRPRAYGSATSRYAWHGIFTHGMLWLTRRRRRSMASSRLTATEAAAALARQAARSSFRRGRLVAQERFGQMEARVKMVVMRLEVAESR